MLRLICAPIRCCRECSPLCVRRFFVVRSRIAGLCGFGDIADGRTIAPTGFSIPVEGFPSNGVLSPDGSNFAVVSQDGAAIDILDTRESQMVERLKAPAASDLTWTTDGLFVSLGYTGKIAHYTVTPGTGKRAEPSFSRLDDIDAGGPGLINGIAENPATHRIVVARTADKEVRIVDSASSVTVATMSTSGQPFDVAFVGDGVAAANYNSDRQRRREYLRPLVGGSRHDQRLPRA